eukprot:NODE_2708_length_877_cov_83.624396_g2235_i0.p1 GENE.NODE_2708_length_877_cov_83.624396_g2235_i0~~NODE_2708_length_877_cov_83.624396_g2235_i0.p1  ORF type:complete len:154 (-),score=28.90 NODE_2708_length_877_cov_83.624396_g2235_i0:45-506(-)
MSRMAERGWGWGFHFYEALDISADEGGHHELFQWLQESRDYYEFKPTLNQKMELFSELSPKMQSLNPHQPVSIQNDKDQVQEVRSLDEERLAVLAVLKQLLNQGSKAPIPVLADFGKWQYYYDTPLLTWPSRPGGSHERTERDCLARSTDLHT